MKPPKMATTIFIRDQEDARRKIVFGIHTTRRVTEREAQAIAARRLAFLRRMRSPMRPKLKPNARHAVVQGATIRAPQLRRTLLRG